MESIKYTDMKKRDVVIVAVTLVFSVTVFGAINWRTSNINTVSCNASQVSNEKPIENKSKFKLFSDFIYDVGPRFGAIKKSDLDQIKFFTDVKVDEKNKNIVKYTSVSVIEVINDKQSEIREVGISNELTPEQLKKLQSFSYSSNFVIRAEYQQVNEETGQVLNEYSTPHFTVVPEQQAAYMGGKDELKKFLRDNSMDARIGVDPAKLQPAKLFFTVSKTGTIENVHLDRSSNFPLVDQKMIELIQNTPAGWEPAQDSNGKKVDQELVVSFGLMGC